MYALKVKKITKFGLRIAPWTLGNRVGPQQRFEGQL